MTQMMARLDSGMATTTTLLDELRDSANHKAWGRVVNHYRPMIVGVAGRMGLSPPDAEDAAQIALMEFARSYALGGYDRSKGRLRHWLFGVARKQIANCKRRRAPEHTCGRDTRTTGFFDRLPGDADSRSGAQSQREIDAVERCLQLVRAEVTPQTMDAFHHFAVLGRPASEVARELGMTENAVFGAKRRVLSRVREIAAELGLHD